MQTFSIITVCYNDLSNLKNTIKSIQAQTFQNFEHIIIDANSQDGTKEFLANFSPSYSWRYISEPDKGIYDGMNKGIQKAEGMYLFFLNSGDSFYHSETLEKVSKELGNESVIFGNVQCEKENLSYIKGQDINSENFKFGMPLPHQGFFYRADLLKKNPYDTSYRLISDFILTRHLVRNYPVKKIDLTIAKYDLTGVSSLNHKKEFLEKIRFFREIKDYKTLVLYAPIFGLKYTLIKSLRFLKVYDKLIGKIRSSEGKK